MNQLTFWSEEHLANRSQLQGLEKVWKTLVETSCLPIYQWLTILNPSGFYGKTYLAYSLVTEDMTLQPYFKGWLNSGMGSHTGFLTLNISECHKDADVCSLSDVLEIGEVPPKYYLSQKACAGILRRAEVRGKTLPIALQKALQATVATTHPEVKETL
jgi:hypothetical protein